MPNEMEDSLMGAQRSALNPTVMGLESTFSISRRSAFADCLLVASHGPT